MSTKKTDPSEFVITSDAEVSSIDLEHEEFRLPDGQRLTDQLAEELAAQAREEIGRRNLIPGRKSLTGAGTHSPTIRVRVPEQLRHAAARRADAEGVTLSTLTRQALKAYLAS